MKSCFQLTILSLILIPFIVAEYTDDSSETPPLAGGYTSDFFENAGNVGVIAAAGNISPSGNTNNIAVPTTTEPSLSEVAVERAVSWLRTQRSQDWGWYNDTPNVLLALQLAAYTELNQIPETTFETQLSTKQMEIEILIMLWRHHEYPISPGRLARYALALNSLCHDPRQFHGHDLIGLLLHHESQKDADFALSALSACSASAHVRKRQIRRLLDIANAVNDHNVDTVAIVILALKCIVQDHRHRNLQQFVRRPGLGLARQQLPDGGFGNLRATALAIQALQNEEFTINHHWNQTAAIGWLLSHQTEQGNFGDITATTDAILALSWRGLSAVRSLECGHVEDPTLENHVEIDDSHFKAHLPNPMNDTEARNVTLTYTLWVGTNVTENYTLAVTVPRNVTFYNVMQIAGEMDNHFTFAASEWPNGHYVHTLAGFKEEPMGYHYWLLYRLPTLPDPSNPPANQLVAPGGVDDLLVDDGEHYLFWYKKL